MFWPQFNWFEKLASTSKPFFFKAKGLGLGFLIFSNLTHHKIHNWNFCAKTEINVCVDHKQQAFKNCFLIVNSIRPNCTCLPSTTQGHFQHFWAELRIFWSPPFKQASNTRLSRSHLKQPRFSCSMMGNLTGVYVYARMACLVNTTHYLCSSKKLWVLDAFFDTWPPHNDRNFMAKND